MPKRQRLTGREIRTGGIPRRYSSSLFSLQILRTSVRTARAACVVSKKVAAKAIERNRIKRQCRAILSTILPTMPPRACVVHAKAGARGASFEVMKKDLTTLFSHVH